MKSSHFCILIALLTLGACGNNSGGSSGRKQSSEGAATLVEATPGTYYTILRPVNFHSNGFIPYGAATFGVKDDQLQVNISLDDDQAVNHRQSLHLGSRCPTPADDVNGDGLVDYNEAMKVVGKVLMPLDNDINTGISGAEAYPKGPSMTYNKIASILSINNDLWDNSILTKGKGIGFEKRVVLVHGTGLQTKLPASVAGYNGEPSNISLPVVCGVLTKIE